METVKHPSLRWLDWVQEIQALSQTGYHYATNEFDRQRYRRLLEISAEMAAENTGLDAPTLVRVFTSQIGYATPRVDVRAAVFQDDQLLMVRERLDGGWTLPGGWVDVKEYPSHAVEREVREEAGYQVHAKKVIGVYDANRVEPLELFHAFKIVFLCDLIGGDAHTSVETSEVAFFARDEIPSNFSGERTRKRHIQDAYRALDFPDCPTVFD
jgi:ADP-ribose pyrophosphatase YjhB (NUDIX family)